MKRSLLLAAVGSAASIAAFALASSHAARDWDVAVASYRAASDANATVALTVIADLSRGVPPEVLLPRLAVGVERSSEASAALAAAAPSPLLGQDERRFLTAATKEASAMRGLEDALRRLAALPPAEWNDAIGDVHAQDEALALARAETAERQE